MSWGVLRPPYTSNMQSAPPCTSTHFGLYSLARVLLLGRAHLLSPHRLECLGHTLSYIFCQVGGGGWGVGWVHTSWHLHIAICYIHVFDWVPEVLRGVHLLVPHKISVNEKMSHIWLSPGSDGREVRTSQHLPPLGWKEFSMMTSSNGNIFRVTGHLCGEFTGPRWIPRTRASDAELWCFLWSASE